MSEKIEVSKIVVRIGKKEVELSLAEAKELQELLNDTFGKKETAIRPYPWTTAYGNASQPTSGGSTLTYSLPGSKAG
jgi:hypothetical protein